jgi:NAD(P)-dependent dehydrogenase (short-subunit alcohol dehydrogenase family)
MLLVSVRYAITQAWPQSTGDVAELAAFLASDAAEYLTGQAIGVDGGAVMR